MQLHETKKTEGSDALFEVKYKHDNPVASLGYTHVLESIINMLQRN